MYKMTRTYTDYNGLTRTEDFYFNLTKAEVFDLEIGVDRGMVGGMSEWLDKLISTVDVPSLADTFKTIILKSYGEKSADGRQFVKVDKNGHKLADDFAQTEAFSDMYVEFIIDSDKSAEFINGVFPTFTEEELKRFEEQAKKARVKMLAQSSENETSEN